MKNNHDTSFIVTIDKFANIILINFLLLYFESNQQFIIYSRAIVTMCLHFSIITIVFVFICAFERLVEVHNSDNDNDSDE